MEFLHYYWVAALVPIGLGWVALQDFVLEADTPAQVAKVRRAAQLIAFLGLVHPAIALVGLDMVRTIDADDPSPEYRRVVLVVVASCVLTSLAGVVWFVR